MQLLFQEFFKKISDFIENIPLTLLKYLVKKIFYGVIIIGILGIFIYSFIKKTYIPVLVFLGIILLAETCHFIRKLREQKMEKLAAKNNKPKEVPKNNYLLKQNKPKNKNLLRLKKRKVK